MVLEYWLASALQSWSELQVASVLQSALELGLMLASALQSWSELQVASALVYLLKLQLASVLRMESALEF